MKTQMKAEQLDAYESLILAVADEFFKRFAEGESLKAVATALVPSLPAWRVRNSIMRNRDLADRYDAALLERAHGLVERAVEYGMQASQIGDSSGFKVAIDVNMKVASKLAPGIYGEKTALEVTGKDGGPLEVSADLTLTAEQAYERMIKGK
jgi:hypothetical protein